MNLYDHSIDYLIAVVAGGESPKEAADEIRRRVAMIDQLLNHCNDAECSECAKIVCPHQDDMHFHHDGCPSCYVITHEVALRTGQQLQK